MKYKMSKLKFIKNASDNRIPELGRCMSDLCNRTKKHIKWWIRIRALAPLHTGIYPELKIVSKDLGRSSDKNFRKKKLGYLLI